MAMFCGEVYLSKLEIHAPFAFWVEAHLVSSMCRVLTSGEE